MEHSLSSAVFVLQGVTDGNEREHSDLVLIWSYV